MKTRDEISISQIFNRIENLNISSGKSIDTNNRPISAALKRPDSKSKINLSLFNNNNTPLGNNLGVSNNYKNNFPSMVTDINVKKINYSSSKPKSNGITLEKERLYEDTIHLKNIINDLKKEISLLKSYNHKYESEISKKDKIIEDVIIDSQNNMFNNPLNESKSISKAKETYLFVQIKKQFKELKNEYKLKCIELDNVKKNVKLTKFNEVGIELKTYIEELARIKSLFLVVSQQNEINEKKLKDFDILHQNYAQQQYMLINLQENISKYETELKVKNEEIFELKNKNSDLATKIKKLATEIKLINQINEKLTKEKKSVNDANAKKSKLEKQMVDLNKEVAYFKDVADKRERRLREMELNMKTFGDKARNKDVHFNIDSIKNIQENPEDKIDKTIMVLRSKLNEATQNYEKLLKKTKLLEEKLNLYEKQYEVQDNYNAIEYLDTNNLSSLNEFSFILIKNFEARKIDSATAIRLFFEKINENKDRITIDVILEILFANFINILGIKNETDVMKIEEYLKNLLLTLNNDWNLMEKKLMEMFSSIKIYTEKEEIKYKKKLAKFFNKYQDYFVISMEKSDPNKTGYVSFNDLRKILESTNYNIKDKYIEYLIYLMKSSKDEKCSLDELKYNVMYDIMSEFTSEKLDEKSSEENDEEQEIVITSEEFKIRLKKIFTKLNENLKKSKKTIREIFRGEIFRPTFEDPPLECHDDALFLKPFIEFLKSIKIELDTIDIYCVYTRLKIVDNSEAISVNYLEYELKNLENGNEILDSNASNNFNMNNETNNKVVDAKIGEDNIEERKNSLGNKNSEKNTNIKINIENNESLDNNKKKFKGEIAVVESDSEKESFAEYEESESKNEYSSNSSGDKEKRRKSDYRNSMEEKYSKKLSEKVNEVDEMEEDSYGDYGFDKAHNYSNESEGNLSKDLKKLGSRDNQEIEDFIERKKSRKLESSFDEKSEKSKVNRPMSARYKNNDQKN